MVWLHYVDQVRYELYIVVRVFVAYLVHVRIVLMMIVYRSQSICGLLGACENSVDDDLSGCTGLLYVP